jgi:uncharacterized protein (TIGR04551 family)
MSRLAAALAALALVLASPAALAQQADKKDELDPKTKAAIDRAVEKAKEDLRNEVRQEMQGAQAAAEFIGATAEGPKLQFLEMNGYFRVRAQLLNGLDLGIGPDASGRYVFPVPFDQPNGAGNRHTFTSANMRLRLEPTMNVSEHVRVRAQVDVLDNKVLGTSSSSLLNDGGSYPSTMYGSSRVAESNRDPRLDRPLITPKRVWGEVQTPLGLLSFGRMPSEWGLGLVSNAGAGLDEDYGDTVDRLQFALPPVSTPIGRLVFVPMIDFESVGALYTQRWAASGTGQPFDADNAGDGTTYGLKVVRLDTPEEIRRKLDRHESSVNYGAYYNYRQQRYTYPDWNTAGFDASFDSTNTSPSPTSIHRSAYAHTLDLWFRWLSPRWRVEAEIAGVYGSMANATNDPAPAVALPKIMLRQWGGAVVTEYKAVPNKLMVGWEIGAASGDSAPGFGNVPGAGSQPYGSLDGQQWCVAGYSANCTQTDRSIRNFRFNPAYRVDLVLFHQILGGVTDAWYLKPKLRWDMFPGLSLDTSIMYARALEKGSTPSVTLGGTGGGADLGVELDNQLSYSSTDGFRAWLQWGVLQPFHGLSTQTGGNGGRAHVLALGLATKF